MAYVVTTRGKNTDSYKHSTGEEVKPEPKRLNASSWGQRHRHDEVGDMEPEFWPHPVSFVTFQKLLNLSEPSFCPPWNETILPSLYGYRAGIREWTGKPSINCKAPHAIVMLVTMINVFFLIIPTPHLRSHNSH